MLKKGLFFLLLFLTFFVEAQQEIQYKLVVAKDGSGDFSTIQDAIDAAKAFPDQRITVLIKNGIYKEKIRVPSWNSCISLIGENRDSTVIVWDDYFDKINRGRNSTFFTYTLKVEADDFYAANLTIENSAGQVGQAVALHVEGNRCQFHNCNILGNQDTAYLSGENSKQFFSGCTITGTSDFIFGSATVVFKDCAIVSKKDSYITAASTNKGKEFGFVFLNCSLLAEKNVSKVYLGRPWRPFAKTVFIACEMGEHITPDGWKEWSNKENLSTTFYAEYNNKGAGSGFSNRIEWSVQLAPKEAEKYTSGNILGDWIKE